MGDVVDKIVKIIEQPGDKIIEQQGKKFSNEIKKQAQEFLRILRKNQRQLERIEHNLQHQRSIVRAIQRGEINASYEWRTEIHNRHLMTKQDHYREVVTAGLKFQSQLNKRLNQKVELVYVYQDEENNPTLYTLDEEALSSALYYQKNPKKYLVGRFNETQKFKSYLTNLTKYQLYEKFNLNYFNFTYKQVIWRFNYGHKKKSDLIMWLNPHFGKHGTKWLKAMVNKQGDIKEAYASVLLDRTINSTKLFNDEKLDNNVHQFMLEVAKVDDESGLLKGDVTVNQIEYAIKGVSASTLGIKQIKKLAQTIIGAESYTKQKLQEQKQAFHQEARSRNHVKNMALQTFQKWNRELGKAIEAKNKIDMNILIRYQPAELSISDIINSLTT